MIERVIISTNLPQCNDLSKTRYIKNKAPVYLGYYDDYVFVVSFVTDAVMESFYIPVEEETMPPVKCPWSEAYQDRVDLKLDKQAVEPSSAIAVKRHHREHSNK